MGETEKMCFCEEWGSVPCGKRNGSVWVEGGGLSGDYGFTWNPPELRLCTESRVESDRGELTRARPPLPRPLHRRVRRPGRRRPRLCEG